MQLNIETKEEGKELSEKLREGDSFQSLPGSFSVLFASYCHLVAKARTEREAFWGKGARSRLQVRRATSQSL